MGEEVAQYNGAYKVSKGMLMNLVQSVIDTPIARVRICRDRRWSSHEWLYDLLWNL